MADTKAHKTANTAKATTKSAKANKNTKITKPTKVTTSTKVKSPKVASVNRSETASTIKAQPAKKGGLAKILCWIISLLALAAVVTAIVVCVINNNDSSLTTETSKGEKVETAYVDFADDKFRLKIPTAYKTLSEEEVKDKYGSESPTVVYANDQNNINVVVSTTDNAISNDQIKEYLDAMKTVLGLGGEIIGTDYYQVGDHNVATIELSSNSAEGNYYNHMMFFSLDGKLVIVTFNCNKDLKDDYQPVGNFILKSLDFKA